MLSKSLIQFSVDEWGCIPSLLFTWGQTMVEAMMMMVTSLKRPKACTITVCAPNPAVGHHQPMPSSETPGHPQASLLTHHLTCLLRNLYGVQEAIVRPGHGTTNWFQIGKGVHQGYILSLCLFNFFAEYIMRNAGLEEAQAGIKTARKNINNLRYADDTNFMAKVKN